MSVRLLRCEQTIIGRCIAPGRLHIDSRLSFFPFQAAILIVVQMHSRDEKSDPNVTGWSFSVLLCVNAVMYALAVLSPKPKEDVEMATHKPPEEQDAGAATTSRANARAEEEARKAAASGAGMAGGLAGALMRNEAVQNAAASAAKDPAVQKAAFNAVKDNPSLAVRSLLHHCRGRIFRGQQHGFANLTVCLLGRWKL